MRKNPRIGAEAARENRLLVRAEPHRIASAWRDSTKDPSGRAQSGALVHNRAWTSNGLSEKPGGRSCRSSGTVLARRPVRHDRPPLAGRKDWLRG